MTNRLFGPTGAPLSGRKAQRAVGEVLEGQQDALVTLTQAFSLFLRLNLWGRIGWLLFGARIFGKKPPAPAKEGK